jgi:hypothetical protein
MVLAGQAPRGIVMPMLPVQSLVPLALFMALFFIASLFVLAALGHFPRAARNDAMKQGFGPALLWVTIVIVALCILVAIAAAWRFIPWFAALIAAGIAILIAPLALQYFSDAFVDGRRGIAIFAAVDLVLALALLWYIAA